MYCWSTASAFFVLSIPLPIAMASLSGSLDNLPLLKTRSTTWAGGKANSSTVVAWSATSFPSPSSFFGLNRNESSFSKRFPVLLGHPVEIGGVVLVQGVVGDAKVRMIPQPSVGHAEPRELRVNLRAVLSHVVAVPEEDDAVGGGEAVRVGLVVLLIPDDGRYGPVFRAHLPTFLIVDAADETLQVGCVFQVFVVCNDDELLLHRDPRFQIVRFSVSIISPQEDFASRFRFSVRFSALGQFVPAIILVSVTPRAISCSSGFLIRLPESGPNPSFHILTGFMQPPCPLVPLC